MNPLARSSCIPALAWLAAAALAPTVAAQTPLRLDVVGGSQPGALAFDLHPGAYVFEACFILTGVDPGPTPLAPLDPNDPRSVQVGTAALGSSFFGLMGIDGHFRVGPLTVPAAPSLLDAPFFFQGVTLPGAATLVDRISNPTAVRMANAGTFRDRGVVMSQERAFAVVLPREDGRWMIVGGGRGGLLSQTAHRTTDVYDDVTDTFVPGPSMTTERSLHTATRLGDGRWLIVGGVDYQNDPQVLCELYDPVLDTFTATGSMANPRMGHSATLLPNGRVLVAGGLTSLSNSLTAILSATATTEIYDPATGAWSPGPNLRTPRAGHVAIPRPNGTVLLAGGVSYDFILPTVRSSSDLFDPVANSIVAGPAMATPHSLIDPVPLGNDRWLVAGGISSGLSPTGAAEIYDASANTWSGAGTMATPRGNQRTWALGNGRFLSVGGANGSILSPTPLASGEIYDAATNSWTPGLPLSRPRAGAAAFLTPRGQVHVMGGESSNGAGTTSCEWWFF